MRTVRMCVVMLLAAAALSAQDVDFSGKWDVYRLAALTRYSLRDYQAGGATATAEELDLASDGTATATVPNLAVQRWAASEGFLILETASGNILYYPRRLDERVYFLVQLDVLKLNEAVVSVKQGSQGHLVVVRR